MRTESTSGADPGLELRRFLRGAASRLRRRRAGEAAGRIAPWALGAAAVLALAWRLRPLPSAAADPLPPSDGRPLATEALVVLLVGVALCVGLAALAASLRRVRRLDVALLADRRLDTREALTTAVWLEDSPEARAHALRAVEALGERRPAEVFPTRRRKPWPVAVSAAALLVAVGLPLPAPDAPPAPAGPDPAVLAAATVLAEEAAGLATELESADAPESAVRALEEIRDVAEQLREAESASREEAALALERLEQDLAEQRSRRSAADAGALERALDALEQARLTREAARAAQQGDAESFERGMQELAERFREGGDFDARERERLALRMREAAAELAESSHAELGRQLEAIADALERGDDQEAARLMEELIQSGSCQAAASDAAGDAALAEARAMLQQALAALGRARPSEEGTGGDEKGRRLAGSLPRDWGVGTTNEAMPPSAVRPGGPQADRQSEETSRWREAYEALHESERLPDGRGFATRVAGQVGEGEHVAVPAWTTASGPGQARRPVVSVPPSYEQAKERALAREEIPPAYRDAVRRYFDALQGRGPDEAPQAAEEE